MTFVTLLTEGTIRPAGGKKVIPAAEFSQLLEAKQLLEKAAQDGELYRKQMAEEAETQRQRAIQDGFEEGMAKWADQIAIMEKTLENKQQEMTASVARVALILAKKIVGKAL